MQIRIDEETKTKAAEILAKEGLTISEAVRLYLDAVVNQGKQLEPLSMNDAEYALWRNGIREKRVRERSGSKPAREFLKSL